MTDFLSVLAGRATGAVPALVRPRQSITFNAEPDPLAGAPAVAAQDDAAAGARHDRYDPAEGVNPSTSGTGSFEFVGQKGERQENEPVAGLDHADDGRSAPSVPLLAPRQPHLSRDPNPGSAPYTEIAEPQPAASYRPSAIPPAEDTFQGRAEWQGTARAARTIAPPKPLVAIFQASEPDSRPLPDRAAAAVTPVVRKPPGALLPQQTPDWPRRAAGEAPAEAAAEGPIVRVSIGRVEIRANVPAPAAAPRIRKTPASLSLDEYLKRRGRE